MSDAYDPTRFQEAHGRFLLDPKSLTEADLAQFAVVDPAFAARARAKRASVTAPVAASLHKAETQPVSHRDLINWVGDFLAPILATYRYRSQQAAAHIETLDTAHTGLQERCAGLEARLLALEARAGVDPAGDGEGDR